MPEITRALNGGHVRAELRYQMHLATQCGDHFRREVYARALAALEDAERLDWIAAAPAWRISMQNWYDGDDIRAAIDRARGATP